MAMTQITLGVTLTAIHCGCCGGTYAINERYRERKQETGEGWHCPYCKCSWGYKEGENARLKRELEAAKNQEVAEQQRHDQTKTHLRETEIQLRAQKGQVTKIKNRVAKGTCPCCRRSFKDMAKHMKTEHPNFIEKDVPEVQKK
jgi:hypothetical protein